MSRYIDADAVIEKKWQAESEACFYALEDVVSVTDIEEAPSIDIVFCKECKWCGEEIESGNPYHWCRLVGVGYEVDGVHFCSYGEREGE